MNMQYMQYLSENCIIGASLSELHTSVIALRVVCVCMYVRLRAAIYWKFIKLNEQIQSYT